MFEPSMQIKTTQKTKIMNSTHKKLSFFSVLFLAFVIISNAQAKAINKFYLHAGAGCGTYESVPADLGLQAIIKNKWSATLSYQALSMKPKNRPSDYQAETGYVLFIPYKYEAKADMSMVSLTAGRYFKLGKNTWATTEGGLSYVSGEKVDFQHTDVINSDLIIVASTTSNYATTKETKSSLGVAARADINWSFASFMGLGCGVFANVNSIQSPIGFQIKLIVGYMGREKKNK
jgi:hypothetical protein